MSGRRWTKYLREQEERYLKTPDEEAPMCDSARLVRIAGSPTIVNSFHRQLQQGRSPEEAAEKVLRDHDSGWIGAGAAAGLVYQAEEIRTFARLLETRE